MSSLTNLLTKLLAAVETLPRTDQRNGYTCTGPIHGAVVTYWYDFGDDTPGYREPSEARLVVELPWAEGSFTAREGLETLKRGERLPARPFRATIDGIGQFPHRRVTLSVDSLDGFSTWLESFDA